MAEPFWKTAGGKRKLLPDLRHFVPKTFGRYFEPFVGGGALFFDLQPKHAVLSDSNAILMAAYRGVAHHVEAVIAKLQGFERGYRAAADPAAYYYVKRKMHASAEIAAATGGSDANVAAWAIFINKTCFNGLWRVGKRTGKFNTPWGKDPQRIICDADRLRAASVALRGARLETGDFDIDVTSYAVQAGDFWYADPPYVPLSDSSDFTGYAKGHFNDNDQVRLRDCAVALKQRGAFVLLSNSSADRVWELYDNEHFELYEVSAPRAINARGTGRALVKELLIKSKTKGW